MGSWSRKRSFTAADSIATAVLLWVQLHLLLGRVVGSIAGWVRGRGAWPPEGAIPAAWRVVWREGEPPDPAARGAGPAGSRGSWLSSPGVDEREELRELAELKHSLDRSGAGNYHEVDF
jgi:hypothetical protein